MYKRLNKKDEKLRIDENGTVKIGYVHGIKKDVRFIKIPTQMMEVDRVEMLAENNARLEKDVEELKK